MYKLLIVDDNKAHIQCILDYVNWESFGFTEIKTALNGFEGFELFSSFQPDLIITDVLMPIMSGVEMTGRIRDTDKNVIIVFMSCYEEFEYAKAAVDNKVCHYLLKPVLPDVLNNLVAEVAQTISSNKKTADDGNTLSSYLSAMQDNLLYQLIYSDKFSEEFIDFILNRLNYKCYSYFVCLKIHTPMQINNSHMYSMFINAFSESFHVDMMEYSDNEFIVLLASKITDEHVLLDEISVTVRNLLRSFNMSYNKALAVGISSYTAEIQNTSTLFYQASQALVNAHHQEHFKVSFYQMAVPNNQKLDLKQLRNELTEILSLRNYEGIDEFLKNHQLNFEDTNDNHVKTFCFTVITSLQFILQEYNGDFDKIFGNVDIVWDKLNNFNSIANVYQWIKNIIIACCEFIESNNNISKNSSLVSTIKEYINKNYHSISSVEEIASNLYLSSGYVKRIFKKHTGQTVFDYLVETRIEEAKKLLESTDITMHGVCEAVGYTSKSHFSETFKKKVGITPKEYQKNHKHH